jgi:RNA polymerase sigma-70 factor (ECF subfamily)
MSAKPVMLSAKTSDEECVAQMMAGVPGALEILYDRYAAAVMGLAYRIIQDTAMAEDVVQETFWRVWRNAASFREERGSFTGWMFTIARNICLDRLRRLKANIATGINEAESLALEEQEDLLINTAETALREIKHQKVRAAMLMLPPEQVEVIEMAFFQGLSRQEISKKLETPLGTIHTRARLALQKLRALLVDQGFED